MGEGFDIPLPDSSMAPGMKDAVGGAVAGGGSDTEMPWPSGTVSDAARQLEAGTKSVTVKKHSQAEELFFRNVSR